ncbi:uncharacterized protein BCR38DRAFT_482423 [Pseudomassariella vexata]|uniref:F-box domain-containing protein n=1 Tax=Pseudomassariella vexata TaxID=1141098 RepID=A0A1Y2EBK5_9PEZI|nr:uncharacterized protein BCR38DRAFT_482423 [Pseudomassariella vexata]ORY68948.1 hypothetical protein BCR38DRAFT_482423 [Pseudomassariella vexata]
MRRFVSAEEERARARLFTQSMRGRHYGRPRRDHGEAMERAQMYVAAMRPIQPVTSSPDHKSSQDPVAGLGRLAILPNEIVMTVLEQSTPRTLTRLLRINKAASTMVRLLPEFAYVRETARGIMERAQGHYLIIMKKLFGILTYRGMRQLLMSKVCEKCDKAGSSFRMVKVKVLCDECNNPTKKII